MSEWIQNSLAEIIKTRSGENLTKEKMVFGVCGVYGGNGVNGYHDKYNSNDEKIIIGRVGEYSGNIHLTQPRSWITDNALIVEFKDKNADLRFWYYFLINLNLGQFTFKGAQPVITGGILKSVNIRYPTNVNTQRKIARILSTIDGQIEKTEAIIAKYQAVQQGLLQDLFTRGIDVHTGQLRPRYEDAPDLYQESALGMIPKEWEVVGLGKLATISSGVTLGKKHQGPDTIKLPYLRVANVQDGYLDLSEITYITIPKSQVERFSLQIGDVLMNEGGDFDKLGRGTIWRGEIDNCLHQNHVFKVRCASNKLLPEYLQIISASPHGKRFFVLSSKQSTNLASINQSQLKTFPIILPDIGEQTSISNIVIEMGKNLELETSRLSKLQLLKQGLMQDLLSGKVAVKA